MTHRKKDQAGKPLAEVIADGFPAFLFRCRTLDPSRTEPRKIEPIPFIRKFAEKLTSEPRLIVVKSRQMMASWIGCAYILFRALSTGAGIHLVLSKEERSAKELIERMRFLLESLSIDHSELGTSTITGTIAFRNLGSRIISLPASPYAVRGLSPRTVFWDEMAFTPNDEEIWAAVKPAVDSGGSFLGVSTPNGPSGVFARLVHGREEGFVIHRLHYHQHPDHDETWEKAARSGLSEARWRREQELSFEGAEGRVFDQFDSQRHLCSTSYLPGRIDGAKLYRGIDFGYRKPAVVWLEVLPDGSMVVFHCLVGDRWPIHQLMQEIRSVDERYGFQEADFTFTAVDPAGAAKNDSGISPVEAMLAAGFKLVWSLSSIAAGIEVVRSLLLDAQGKVRLRVDSRCADLIRAFQGYAWAQDGELPVKDGVHDHPMDALRYLLVNLFRANHRLPDPTPKVRGTSPPVHLHPVSRWFDGGES